jgi:hypothetical protein
MSPLEQSPIPPAAPQGHYGYVAHSGTIFLIQSNRTVGITFNECHIYSKVLQKSEYFAGLSLRTLTDRIVLYSTGAILFKGEPVPYVTSLFYSVHGFVSPSAVNRCRKHNRNLCC